MKSSRWMSIALLLIASFLWPVGSSAQAPAGCVSEHALRVEFDAAGHLVSSPPTRLGPGQCLHFAIHFTAQEVETPRLEVLRFYVDGIRGIAAELDRATQAEKKHEPFPTFGVDPADLKQVQQELCGQARLLVTDLRDPHEKEFFGDTLDILGCPAIPPASDPVFVPKAAPIARVGFSVAPTCIAGSGEVHALKTVGLAIVGDPQGKGGEDRSGELVLPAGCDRLTYELRRTNPFFEQILAWWESHKKKLTPELRDKIAEAARALQQPVAKEMTVSEIIDHLKPTADAALKLRRGGTLTDAEKKLIEEVNDATKQELLPALARVHDEALTPLNSQAKTTGWVKSWLWLSQGTPSIDPFNLDADAQALKAKRASFALLDAEIKNFELVTGNQGLQLAAAKDLDVDLAPWGKRRVDRDRIGKEITALETKLAQENDLRFLDTLLYQGLFFANGGRAVMRHHDTLNRYRLMDVSPVREISEQERLFVLVENEVVQTQLKLAVTVTPIQKDLAGISEELALSAAGDFSTTALKQNGLPSTTTPQQLTQFLQLYSRLVRLTALLSREAVLPSFPLPESRDETPAFVSRIVPHDPAEAPATVQYVIKTEKDGTETSVGEGSYRLNKLYHVRFRAGLLYSRLETKDFTLTNGQVTETVVKHGVDGTFGVQIYPLARDLRRPRPQDRWIPVLYLGLSMKTIRDNLFAGVGIEPFSGVTLMAGQHLGRGERLIRENGVPTRITDTWKNDWFFSLALDVDAFKRLFTLRDLLPAQ